MPCLAKKQAKQKPPEISWDFPTLLQSVPPSVFPAEQVPSVGGPEGFYLLVKQHLQLQMVVRNGTFNTGRCVC